VGSSGCGAGAKQTSKDKMAWFGAVGGCGAGLSYIQALTLCLVLSPVWVLNKQINKDKVGLKGKT
jgi:hypothetical protein